MDRSSQISAIALLGLLSACGGEEGYTLQQVMYQVEYEEQAIEAALETGDLATVASSATAMGRWCADPSFAAEVQTRSFTGDADQFLALRADFLGRIDRLASAASSGDAALTMQGYAALRMACEVCHARFRPEL